LGTIWSSARAWGAEADIAAAPITPPPARARILRRDTNVCSFILSYAPSTDYCALPRVHPGPAALRSPRLCSGVRRLDCNTDRMGQPLDFGPIGGIGRWGWRWCLEHSSCLVSW